MSLGAMTLTTLIGSAGERPDPATLTFIPILIRSVRERDAEREKNENIGIPRQQLTLLRNRLFEVAKSNNRIVDPAHTGRHRIQWMCVIKNQILSVGYTPANFPCATARVLVAIKYWHASTASSLESIFSTFSGRLEKGRR